jgi:hypothetical protein
MHRLRRQTNRHSIASARRALTSTLLPSECPATGSISLRDVSKGGKETREKHRHVSMDSGFPTFHKPLISRAPGRPPLGTNPQNRNPTSRHPIKVRGGRNHSTRAPRPPRALTPSPPATSVRPPVGPRISSMS